MGALGGMGDALQNIGGSMFKAELDRDARQADSDLALARAKSLEEFKAGLGERDRKQMVERIDTAAKGIIGGKIAQKANDLYGPGSNLTEADLADEEKQALALTDGEKAAARTQAGVETGYISPKDAATIERDERRSDATERATAQRETAAAMRDETQRYIAELRDETAQKKIEQLIRRTGDGNDRAPANAKMIEYLVSNGMDRKDATSRVLGENEGKSKDPVGLTAQLATTLMTTQGSQLRQLSEKSGKPVQQVAMEMAADQIEAATKRFRPPDGAAPNPPAPAPKPAASPPAPAAAPKPAASATSALPLPKVKDQLVSGKVYQTSRGPAKWNGTAFEQAN